MSWITSDKAIYDKLFYNLNTTGPTLSPFDSYMLMRGLKTLKLRMEKATENAQEIVAFLKTHQLLKKFFIQEKVV